MFQIISRCKITAFFGYKQVYFAEKCRFFDFLFRRIGILPVVTDVFALLILLYRHRFGVDITALEDNILGILEFDTLLIADNSHVVEEDIVHRFALQSLDIYGLLASDTGNVAERDIRPVGEESFLIVAIRSTHTGTLIGIAGRDQDSRLHNILHDQIVAVDVLAPTATTGCRLEAATDIRTVEEAVLHGVLLAEGLRTADDDAVDDNQRDKDAERR